MERRLDHRYPVESLEARIDPISGLPSIAVRVRNISAGGAQLLADRPLNIGSVLKVDIGGLILSAEVRYRKLHEDGFLAGIEFSSRLSQLELDDILARHEVAASTKIETGPKFRRTV